MKLIHVLRRQWGITLLFIILVVIVIINFKPGYFILGNDNYCPELNPGVTFERTIQDPAWRSYRGFGLPSDSEQADIVRSGLYLVLSRFIPLWLLSQSFIFISYLVAGLGIAFLVRDMGRQVRDDK